MKLILAALLLLLGSIPRGIALTKTLGYTGNNLTSVGYS